MRTDPSWRQGAGMTLILLLIASWAVVAVTVGGLIEHLPWPVVALYYLLAGTLWIVPLRPLLRWMETGRWR